MANHKSAEKRIRSSERKTRFNRRVKSLLKTQEKLLLSVLEKKDKAAVKNNLSKFFFYHRQSKKKWHASQKHRQ